jgi:hypothetical protein
MAETRRNDVGSGGSHRVEDLRRPRVAERQDVQEQLRFDAEDDHADHARRQAGRDDARWLGPRRASAAARRLAGRRPLRHARGGRTRCHRGLARTPTRTIPSGGSSPSPTRCTPPRSVTTPRTVSRACSCPTRTPFSPLTTRAATSPRSRRRQIGLEGHGAAMSRDEKTGANPLRASRDWSHHVHRP